jgi:hypothetical protein
MSPYELESLPHTLKRVRTQSLFVMMSPSNWTSGSCCRQTTMP